MSTLTPSETEVDTDIDEAFRSIVDPENKNTDTDDPEMMSHYVSKEDIVRAATENAVVYALCGKKWTPKKNPENYPVCKTCEEVYMTMRDE